MLRQITDLLAGPSQYRLRRRHRWAQFAPREWAHEERQPTGSFALRAAALALLAGAGYYFGPDLVRYLKLRNM
jgi:hypothetical protein